MTDTAVLTDAHVLANARSVRVVFNPGLPNEWSIPASVEFCEPAGDIAVLVIDTPEEHRRVEPVRYGQVGTRAAVLPCRAVGFPLFKLRTEQAAHSFAEAVSFRDVHQADGTISTLSGWREGTLEMTVPVPPEDTGPERSPWEGMSGAVVWCADRIVGVVSRHHRNEGLNRLAAVRISRWYDQLDVDQLGELGRLIGLPTAAAQLVNVIPMEPTQLLTAAYTAQIEDNIAPTYLHDREQELAELTAFCASDKFYAWWQAGPWAGKTALMSWLALHPPVGVTVVAFFITRRLPGQADSSAFSEAMIEQLTVLTGESDIHPGSLAARDGQRRWLLKKAAAQAAAEGRRLLLLVDGLDEDEGVPPAGRSSIAALLPRRPVEGLRVLVTSRHHPGVPHDVAPDHPLREFWSDRLLPDFQPRELEPSKIGAQHEMLAKTELVNHLQGSDQLAKDILGYIAAAGGGLTVVELGQLAGARYVDLQARLGSVLGRSLNSWTPTDILTMQAELVYLFAHDTLRMMTDKQLGYDLSHYRERIHQWADAYQRQDWPEHTPRYLGRPYSRLLTRIGDLSRLVRLVTDSCRHDRMLIVTLTDAAALAEILDTQQLLVDAPEPDLAALGLIAVESFRLSLRNAALPTQLPALWVQLGQPERAQSLARSIKDPDRQAQALDGVAKRLAEAGQADRAEQVARSITQPDRQAEVLVGVAKELAGAGQVTRAEQLVAAAGQVAVAGQLARSITDPDRQAQMLAKVAEVLVSAGQADRAEQAARSITDPYWQVLALARVTAGLVEAGQVDRAEQLAAVVGQMARSITDPYWQALALARATVSLVEAGQVDRAEQLVAAAEQVARSITDPYIRAAALVGVAVGLVAAGQVDRAEQLARSITDPDTHALALGPVVGGLVAVGQVDRAEQVARSITDPYMRAAALVEVAEGLVAAGQTNRAKQLAAAVAQLSHSITDPDAQAQVLAKVAEGLVAAGQVDRAEQLAVAAEQIVVAAEQVNRLILNSFPQQALGKVAESLVTVGQVDRAEQLARSITDPDRQAQVLAQVAAGLVTVGQVGHAEQLARSITDPSWQMAALAWVAEGLSAAGQMDRAEQLAVTAKQAAVTAEQAARSITDPLRQAQALAWVAESLMAAGQVDRAEQLARSITDPGWQMAALAWVAESLMAAGQVDRAEQLARSITQPDRQAEALTGVAKGLAGVGQVDRAEQLARSITDPDKQAQALVQVAETMVERDFNMARSRSRWLIAQILASNSSPYAMPLLGSLAPAAVIEMATVILDIFKPSPMTR